MCLIGQRPETGDRRCSFRGQPSRCDGVVPCAHVRRPSKNFIRTATWQPFTGHWLLSAAGARACACLNTLLAVAHDGNGKREIHDGQNKGGRVAKHTMKDQSTADVWPQTRKKNSSTVVAQHSTAQRVCNDNTTNSV